MSELLRQTLWEKAAKEQSDFIDGLKLLTPEQIIDKAYEKVMRDDILLTFENDFLEDKQVAALVKLDKPLAACYDAWMETDYSHMEMLRDTIEDYADELIEENEAEKKDKKKHEPER